MTVVITCCTFIYKRLQILVKGLLELDFISITFQLLLYRQTQLYLGEAAGLRKEFPH